jgi:hypothetical protein
MSDLEKRFVIKFFFDEGKKGAEIFRILTEHYGADAPCQTTVKYWVKELKFGRTDLHDLDRPGRPANDDLALAITHLHEEEPTYMARDIARALSIPLSTTCYYLRNVLGMSRRHGRWVPHLLTQGEKDKRTVSSKQMLETLRAHRKTSFQYLYTGDESWILYTYNQRSFWIAPWEQVPEVERPTHHQKKQMLSVFFNGTGHYVTDWLPEGRTMNSPYYVEEVLTPLADSCYPQRSQRPRHLVTVHFDNAPIHNTNLVAECLERRKLTRMSHPPYSPDLAPCDFFLFGYLKGKLAGQSFDTLAGIQGAVREVLEGISGETWCAVFEDWIKRLEECIQREGEYVE